MRIKDEDLRVIQETVHHLVSPLTQKYSLYLFGSRVFDHLKGGDIDLLLLIPEKDFLKVFDVKFKILASIKMKIGDQKIDFVIKNFEESKTCPFVVSVLKEAIAIKQLV